MKKVGNNPHSLPFLKSLKIQKLQNSIIQSQNKYILHGLYGSSKSFFIKQLFNSKTSFLWILNDKESAAYHYNDLENFMEQKHCSFYPSSYNKHKDFKKTDSQNIFKRTEVIKNLSSRGNSQIIVTYPEAIFEKILQKKEIKKRILKISVGKALNLEILNEQLFDFEFNREDFVLEPGDFSVRGGIIDVFSFSNDLPYRIEFFGDEVESIRTFHIESQLSNKTFESIEILADLENKENNYKREDLFSFINKNSIVITENLFFLKDKLEDLYSYLSEKNSNQNRFNQEQINKLFYSGISLFQDLKKFSVIDLKGDNSDKQINFNIIPQPAFNKKFNLLIENLNNYKQKGYSIRIFCSSENQINRFKEIFEQNETLLNPILIDKPIYKGYVNHDEKEVCYSDHEIFDRYHKFKIKSRFSHSKKVNLNELNQLEIGDYVTHIDHGIGVFGGLKKIKVNDKIQEAIKLTYGERDTLYVSIHLIHKICKYNGKDGTKPKIFKLGSGAWKKIKLNAKSRVKKVAFNLIEAYAKRKLKKGFQYGPDSSIQHELEASFLYEDTPDQIKSTIDIKNDMESLQPMDRLICGDVGFGKTEIAIRAAFKAI
ncbi:MAG: transcription-repair coupling factor, partial [Flavobacteriaceae bacterium]|nr:transcription-repair coupling factor [Flavobacteriaceae bacterium]